MRSIFVASCLAASLWPAAIAVSAEPDPLALYGPAATYEILRDGDVVGEHRIDFSRQGDALMVESRSQIEVPFLFLTGYEFDYRARTIWNNGALIRLEAQTNDDGAQSSLSGERADDQVRIVGPSGDIAIPADLPLSEHWSRRFIDGGRQLNTITGKVNSIEIRPLGKAFVPMANGIAQAERFQVDGDIKLETWYDEAGRWLGMRFAAQDSSIIEYRCRTCRADVADLP
jgi:hypothetical protein